MVGFEVFRSNIVVESMSHDSLRILEEVFKLRKPLSDLARRIIGWCAPYQGIGWWQEIKNWEEDRSNDQFCYYGWWQHERNENSIVVCSVRPDRPVPLN